jgi:hypothetical protein
MKKLIALLFTGILVSSASAQWLTVSGGGTITLGQSASIVASPRLGVATAYNLIENGVVVQTVGTFGLGGSDTDVGSPRTFTVTPSAVGTYVYTAQVALNLIRAHLDYLPSDNSVTLTVTSANLAPTISWNPSPGTIASGASYTVSARGHDDDGNLTQVNIWKNGNPFAFAGGGNGTDGDSENTSADGGPQVITFTAQAVDANGAVSATISRTVTVVAANQAPTITWNTVPGTVANSQAYTISAHGHDADGNLTQVNVWRNGSPFAFAGGGNGADGDSGNATADAGPQSITYSAQAVDSDGATSSVIDQTVTIAGPVNQPPSVTLSAPGSQTITAGTTLTLSSSATDPDGNLTAHNLDIQRPAGDWNFQGGFAAGSPFQGGPVGSGRDSTRTANFTFTDVGNYTVRAAADDGGGWVHSGAETITVIPAPIPNQAPTVAWLSAPASAADFQAYIVTARGQDADGNLAQVNVWKNGVPFAFAGGGDGSTGDSGNTTNDGGPQTVTFTAQAVDALGATSATISHTVTVTAPNRAPSVVWTATPGSVASYQSYTVSAHARDADGNLTQVNIWKNGVPFAFAGGGDGTDGDSGNSSADPGPQTVVFTAQAVDSMGAASSVITQTVTTAAAPPVQFTIVTTATGGGGVSAGGVFTAGTAVTVTASPDANHDFAGWSGDASGEANPLTLTVDRDKTVQADFALKNFTVTTSAGTGGGVSPGGTFASGSTAIITAAPDANHDFIGWSGDASGAANPLTLTVDRDKTVQAIFTLKNFTVTTSAGAGGGVSPGGNFTSGSTAIITATPDSNHDFSGWSGDAMGAANPLTLTVNTNRTVQANFSLKTRTLTTTATPGGSISAGGTYTHVTTATVVATPDSTHDFSGWVGDASGVVNPLGVLMDRDRAVTAIFSPKLFTLTTAAGPGGSVSPGGVFATGTILMIAATPDGAHDFTGWSGDAAGSANPLSLALDRNKSVQASFTPKYFPLTTSATTGGVVTAGGSYPFGTVVTLSAVADATHRFVGWSGDAAGGAPAVAITMTAARSVQALFTDKLTQIISFPTLAVQNVGAGELALSATSSSGLPVTFTVISGSATLATDRVQFIAPGAVSVQATQAGDGFWLPASPVTQTFNVVAAAVLKYRGAARTLLESTQAGEAPPFLLEKP